MKFKLLLLIIVVLGALLRLYRLGEIPVSLYWDEAAIGYDAFALAATGKDMHGNAGMQAIFPSYGDYKLPLYIWIDSLVMKLMAPSAFSVRLPSALAGAGLIIIIYYLSLQLFKSKKIAIAAAFVMATMPNDILFSRTAFEGHLALFFIGLTALLWLLSRKKYWLLPLAGVTAALAVYSYFSARIVVPILGILTLTYTFKETSWKWKVTFVGSLLLWLIFLIPIYRSPYYAASNQFRLSTQNLTDIGQFAVQSNILRQQSGNSYPSRIIYHRYFLQAKAIIKNIGAHFDPRYLFISGDANLRHSTGQVGLMYLSWLPLFFIGWIVLLRTHVKTAIWLLGIWIIAAIPAAVPVEVPHALRSMNALLVFPLVVSLSINWTYKRKLFFLILFSFWIVETGIFLHDYLSHYPRRSASAWQDGYYQLTSYLKQHESEFSSVTMNYPQDGRLFLYFLFHNQVNPQTVTFGDNFAAKSFSKYKFNTTAESRTGWQVTAADSPIQPDAIIRDSNNQPKFYIIKQ